MAKKAIDVEKKLILRAMGRLEGQPFTKTDIETTRSLMIQGNYPASISDCEVVGISGGCGINCSVFQTGNCDSVEEGIENGSWTREEAYEIGYDITLKE